MDVGAGDHQSDCDREEREEELEGGEEGRRRHGARAPRSVVGRRCLATMMGFLHFLVPSSGRCWAFTRATGILFGMRMRGVSWDTSPGSTLVGIGGMVVSLMIDSKTVRNVGGFE